MGLTSMMRFNLIYLITWTKNIRRTHRGRQLPVVHIQHVKLLSLRADDVLVVRLKSIDLRLRSKNELLSVECILCNSPCIIPRIENISKCLLFSLQQEKTR